MSVKTLHRKATPAILRVISVSISAILGVFCDFGGCAYGPAPEYGAPHADFQISGTVVSDDRELPIEGLAVSIRDTLQGSPAIDSTETDSGGEYALRFSGMPGDYTWRVSVRDVDSTRNGSFVAKDTLISIAESELREPEGSWYEGHAEKVVDLRMKRNN